MTEVQFKKPEMEDQEWITRMCRLENTRSCESNFANFYLWNHMFPVELARVNEQLVMKAAGEDIDWRFPLGEHSRMPDTIRWMEEYSRAAGKQFVIWGVTPEQFSRLEQAFPGRYQISYVRDEADYVYEREKLISLSGKKYHGKKNHINKFTKTYPDWSYEKITDDNVEECFRMALKWRSRNENEIEAGGEIREEFCITQNVLRMMKELKLCGGLLRADGQVCAFSVGEPQSDDTFVVHIEKALEEYEGAYTMINQQFVLHETEGYAYINREDDAGDEGLRQAKLSYHPVFMAEKGCVTCLEH